MLSEDSDPAGPPEAQKAESSFIVFRAASAAEVRKIVEGDLFYTEDVVSTRRALFGSLLRGDDAVCSGRRRRSGSTPSWHRVPR